MLKSLMLSSSFAIQIAPDLALSRGLSARVDALWKVAVAERPDLFDGPILSVIELSAERAVLTRATYRQLWAALHDPAVKKALGLCPLAVSGILSCKDGLVFGRRASNVTQGAGHWELAPSGGVEATPDNRVPDLKAQILTELREEVGLIPEQVIVKSPVGLIEDFESGLVDVVFPLFADLSAADVMIAHAAASTKEYEALHVTSAPHLFALGHKDLLEVTRAILDAFVRR